MKTENLRHGVNPKVQEGREKGPQMELSWTHSVSGDKDWGTAELQEHCSEEGNERGHQQSA